MQVRELIARGYQIGIEHADKRRFQTSSWHSAGPINARREADVFAALEAVIADHSNEYVRLIGIDREAKRRVVETIVHRPGSPPPTPGQYASSTYSNGTSASNGTGGSSTGLGSDVVTQVRQLLAQGHKLGIEYADKRRFQTSSWHSAGPINARREADVLAALAGAIADHSNEYVRLIGIDREAKRRIAETIVHRPGSKPASSGQSASSSYSGSSTPSSGTGSSNGSSPSGSTRLSSDVVSQVRQLLAQGHQISTEYADERRFKTSSWQNGGVIHANREADVLAALEATISEHSRAYVRLVGVDPNAKRRVLETTIQRPSK